MYRNRTIFLIFPSTSFERLVFARYSISILADTFRRALFMLYRGSVLRMEKRPQLFDSSLLISCGTMTTLRTQYVTALHKQTTGLQSTIVFGRLLYLHPYILRGLCFGVDGFT